MKRTEIIQRLINKIGAQKYLEIGMGCGNNHNAIQCEYKLSVDPIPTVPVTHSMTSDEFFKQNNETFDVIFIDGLHWSEQVYKDIKNSLDVLNDGGYIVCHDINPPDEDHQLYPQPQTQANWTGDCWKGWVKLKGERSDLNMSVVDTDYGCGIIKVGNQELIKLDKELNYEQLNNNRVKLLNLITIDQFITENEL
jgi:hypothetical protein